MEQLGHFIINHLGLWVALVIVLILIYVNELLAKKKQAKEISPQEAVGLINHEEAVIVDLRDIDSFKNGHIIGAIRATAEDFTTARMDKYKTTQLILVCAKGLQSGDLATKLKAQGFASPFVLAGGIASWQAAELPLVKGK